MARNARLGWLAAALCPLAFAAYAANTDFERVFPGDYREMLLRARNAYQGQRYEEAFLGYQRTACGGDKESQSALGRMYLLGQGVTRDDFTGYAWLKVAAEVRMRGYQSIVQKIEGAMTPEQRRIADQEATTLIDLYGLRATNMSCNLSASQGGHIQDIIACTPRMDGRQLLLRRCATAPTGGGRGAASPR